MLARRVFQRFPGQLSNPKARIRYKWRHGALCLYSAVLLRDPQILVSWLQQRLPLVPCFQHRKFFRMFAVILRVAVLHPTYRYNLVGFYLYLVGKISVTGNARSRSYCSLLGQTSAANLRHQHAEAFTLVRTNTGCLGLTVRFTF